MVLKNDLFIQVNDLLANRDPVSGGTIKTSNISNSNPLVVSRTNNINIHQSQFENINKQLELLQASVQNMPNNILDGMGVFTYNVNVIAVAIGSILLNGRILKYNANVSLPLINDELIYTTIIINTSTVGIKYLIASNNQGAASINVVTNPNITDVIIAKIVINNINGDIDDDANEDRSNNYIVSGKDLLFNSQYVIDDDTKFELQNVLTDLLAENLTGVLRANSDLSITNQDNSVLIDSNGMKIYNDEVKYAEFNRDGIYFTNEDGNLLSQYTKDGAVIGNISITPSSLQSTNFQSGNNGFKIGSDGNVEFNNITARGTIYARAGLIGGVSLTHNKTYVGTGSFNNANTAYYLDSDGKFSLKDKFSWDGTTLSITGSITAVSGIIGGWTITSGALYTGDMYLNGSNGSITTTNFSVNSAGTMSASSAIISGNITANTLTANSGGTIAGWSMTATTLSGGTMVLNSDGSIVTGNFGVTNTGILSATGAIISGNITADTLTTTSGTIGGWTISTTSLSATNMALNDDGSIITTNFSVTSSGLLSATSAVIIGDITADTLTANTAGSIAGWTLTAGKLANGNVGMQPATYPFYAGHATPASAPFRVTPSGNLYARDGIFEGALQSNVFTSNTINATSGDLIVTPSTKIDETITVGSGTISFDVLDGSVFSASYGAKTDDIIKVDTEYMRVTSVSTNTITVTREFNSSTGAEHLKGAVILKIGEYNTTNKGYVKLDGQNNKISVHDIDINTTTITDTEVVKLGNLGSDKYGLQMLEGIISLNKLLYDDTTDGLWVGRDSGTYKLNLGSEYKYLKWTGTDLELRGNIAASKISGRVIGEDNLYLSYDFTTITTSAAIAIDSTSNGNDGTINGYAQVIPGVIGTGIYLENGAFSTGFSSAFSKDPYASTYVDSPYTHNFTNDVSIVVWTNFRDNSHESLHGHSNTNTNLFLGCKDGSLKVGAGNDEQEGLHTIVNDEYVCIGLTLDASESVYKVYYNGVLVYTGSFTSTSTSTETFSFGGLTTSSGIDNLLYGYMDSLKIYTNQVLTDDDMAIMYTSPTGQGIYIDTSTIINGNLSTLGYLDSNGQLNTIDTKTNDYELTINDYSIVIDASGGDVEISTPATPITGQTYSISCLDSTNTADINFNGKNYYSSASNVTLTAGDKINIQYSGTIWV